MKVIVNSIKQTVKNYPIKIGQFESKTDLEVSIIDIQIHQNEFGEYQLDGELFIHIGQNMVLRKMLKGHMTGIPKVDLEINTKVLERIREDSTIQMEINRIANGGEIG